VPDDTSYSRSLTDEIVMKKKLFFLTLSVGLVPVISLAGNSPSDTTSSTDSTGQVVAPSANPNDTSVNTSSETPLGRWFELDAANFSVRYRNSFGTDGVHVFDDWQERSVLGGKFKFDKDGKYFVGFRASSGRYFNWSYANFSGLDYRQAATAAVAAMSPLQQATLYSALYADPQGATISSHLEAGGWGFYVRDLYASATPVKALTFEFGGIPIERGVGTEITTFDEDGYISGERMRVHDASHLFFDEIDVTGAYLGDVTTPNFFDRYDRLTQNNYRQFLVEKKLTNRVKASADYTWLGGTHTWREAVLTNVKEVRAVDSVRVELYQRTNSLQFPAFLATDGYGWAFTASKRFRKRVTLEGGYASIDQDYGVYALSGTYAAAAFPLNGDSFQVGNRFFGRANVKLASCVSLFGFYTHEINAHPVNDPLAFSWTTQNLNFGMQIDFKPLVKSAHLL
jgi:hypothetical protein